MEFTQQKIDELKKQHGKVFLFQCADDPSKSCLLRRVNRNDLSMANMAAILKNADGSSHFDAHKFNETILLNTWLDGDEEIKTNDQLFLGVSEQLDAVIEKAKFEVKEL
ncbi:MAG TPA: hypothetical protein VK172_14720 [Lentimicrobium sp.]|nr:hypothetical protein [Bacteroidales bacterium]HLO92415.1 hypothetical protein [Lentimicrobium sp.]